VESLQSESLPETAQKEKGRSGVIKFLVDILETVLWAVALFVLINLVSARVRVDGDSMKPTLFNGELAIVSKLAYRLGEPARGDIIVFHFPIDPTQEFIKRVIGLPGDAVSIHDGAIYVNGLQLQEPYLDIKPDYWGDWTVAEDALFVLGDNRNNSLDSHNWGTVPMEYVIGKALFVYWPFSNLGIIQHSEPQLVTP